MAPFRSITKSRFVFDCFAVCLDKLIDTPRLCHFHLNSTLFFSLVGNEHELLSTASDRIGSCDNDRSQKPFSFAWTTTDSVRPWAFPAQLTWQLAEIRPFRDHYQFNDGNFRNNFHKTSKSSFPPKRNETLTERFYFWNKQKKQNLRVTIKNNNNLLFRPFRRAYPRSWKFLDATKWYANGISGFWRRASLLNGWLNQRGLGMMVDLFMEWMCDFVMSVDWMIRRWF